MTNTDKLEASLIYPREVKIRDGRNVSLRLMEAGDNQRILNFANSLPPDDLLFLRTDITDPRTIDEWVRSIEAGTTITVVAELDSGVVGYASLHTEGARWTRLVGEIFRLGQDFGLKKMAAMMTPDQKSARAAFEELGFRVEATLQDWVVDREGGSRDLVIMSLSCER